jgi:TatD DNase family protein
MHLVDTHCHIQSAGLTQGERTTRELWAKAPELTADQLVANAVEAGVTKMICVGCDLEDSRLAVEFVQERPECWASIGIHPHEAAQHTDNFAEFVALAGRPKVVAIGECGLDYFYEHSPRNQQIQLLEQQLQLAADRSLPVIFHVREAFDDFWPIFANFEGHIRGVLHSFTDSAANMEKAVGKGLSIGVNGIATFTKDPKQLETYKNLPLDHLLLETDAPFLTPVPFRGTINEPKQISTVAAFLAELRQIPLTELATATSQNACTLFDI